MLIAPVEYQIELHRQQYFSRYISFICSFIYTGNEHFSCFKFHGTFINFHVVLFSFGHICCDRSVLLYLQFSHLPLKTLYHRYFPFWPFLILLPSYLKSNSILPFTTTYFRFNIVLFFGSECVFLRSSCFLFTLWNPFEFWDHTGRVKFSVLDPHSCLLARSQWRTEEALLLEIIRHWKGKSWQRSIVNHA